MEKQTSLQKNNLDQIPKMSVYAILRRKDVVRVGRRFVQISKFSFLLTRFLLFINTGFTPSSVLDQDVIVP